MYRLSVLFKSVRLAACALCILWLLLLMTEPTRWKRGSQSPGGGWRNMEIKFFRIPFAAMTLAPSIPISIIAAVKFRDDKRRVESGASPGIMKWVAICIAAVVGIGVYSCSEYALKLFL